MALHLLLPSHFNPRTPCGVRQLLAVVPGNHEHFNPRTPCGVRLHLYFLHDADMGFQSTHPLRGATLQVRRYAPAQGISIHAPLAGCDIIVLSSRPSASRFQSTHPLRGATFPHKQRVFAVVFQSTHPLRGATTTNNSLTVSVYISIHAPLAGCDCNRLMCAPVYCEFQSTHPLRGATSWQASPHSSRGFQSTHPLRGAT